ncbi:hypothetical protein ONS95_002826 [Cadophora gregata]|uniref:uncharacterized protein n=1 Tax=Cadophora gregata TaxID=51156 RepID=UPI0026DC7BEB|nr:uncharacterized protein ONS95_002826 [Cadophora gregata]KAK0110175.1 hypothetical protein ONS95_002826 [Cadophora gregata]KAK0110210.1 hypothetical protein ONS96_001833 [Cadophora gregata f. sp. sojae]
MPRLDLSVALKYFFIQSSFRLLGNAPFLSIIQWREAALRSRSHQSLETIINPNMVLGPLDKRSIRTRCEACSRRRIKCEGGSPCAYCMKKKITCVPPAPSKRTGVVFVNKAPSQNFVTNSEQIILDQQLVIPKVVDRLQSADFIARFFSVFIVRNDFSGGSLDMDAIVTNFQYSPSLYHAAVAVGALDASKHALPPAKERRVATVAALSSYKTSLVAFQEEIQRRDIRKNDAALWTTLFLGLFELMSDFSGEGWVKHILYGTSRMLQLRGPEAHLTGRGRSFFLTVRIFEISRALAFSESTFLNERPWVELMEKMWLEDASDWHPKEKMYDLMLETHALGEKVWDVVKEDTDLPSHMIDEALTDLGTAGLTMRDTIDNWHTSFLQSSYAIEDDPWSLLAIIYYHAISIYLTGIFDYRPQFDMIPYPSLSYSTIQAHVYSIISQTKLALSTTNLAGAFLVFALRVAGARAVNEEQRVDILQMLAEISTRSFVVADAFRMDLEYVWSETESRKGRA